MLTGSGYASAKYYQSNKLIKQADQLVKDSKYTDALAKYDQANNAWPWKSLGVKRSEAELFQTMQGYYTEAIADFAASNWQACVDASGKVTEKFPDYSKTSVLRSDCETRLVEKQKADATPSSIVIVPTTTGTTKTTTTKDVSAAGSSVAQTGVTYPDPVACQKVVTKNIPSPLTSSSVGKIVDTSNVINYVVYGWNESQVSLQLSQCGPFSYAGYTTWSLYWRWDSSTTVTYPDNYCVLNDVAVSISAATYLPVWKVPTSPPPQSGLESIWNNFVSSLTVHENGHKQHGIDAANQIYSILTAHRSACDNATVNAEANAIFQKAVDNDVKYDAATNHGGTQGASF